MVVVVSENGGGEEGVEAHAGWREGGGQLPLQLTLRKIR